MTKNIIYVRVSTEDQQQSIQLDACSKWCAQQGLSAEIIEDTISGSKASRPGFDRLMTAVRAGHVQNIICYKLDRIGRSLPHLAMTIEEFKSRGVALVAVSQGIDTRITNPMANLQLGMLMVFAEFERALIRERVIAGIASAKKRGVKFGRKLTHAVTPALIEQMMLQGQTLNQISKSTGVNRGTIFRMAKEIREAATNCALQDGDQ